MLKLKVIACDVLNREVSYLCSRSKCFVNVTYLHQGLHCTPDKLREMLQQEIDKAEEGFPYNYYGHRPHYDYIILAYGLCSNGIVGLQSKSIPLVVPRGHDCITLLLGSKERYKEYFDSHPGTYWYSAGWIERSTQPGKERVEGTYQEYLDKYGEDNADYLMEMEQRWMTEYNSAALVSWDCLGNAGDYRDYTKECADFMKWSFAELKGDPGLMEKLLNGQFDENEVLVVPPEKKIQPSHDELVIKAED